MEDQEILLNLIERSKQSRKSRRKWRPTKVKKITTRKPPVTEPVVRNYVTKPPSVRKPKKKVKNIATDLKKIRQKRRKVKSKPRPSKTRKKHSNMEVSLPVLTSG